MMVICAWCGKFLRFEKWQRGEVPELPISHGICPACKKIVEEEIEDLMSDKENRVHADRFAA